VPGFVGLAGRDGGPNDDLADLKAVPESAGELWRLWRLRPATGPIGRESVIGPDDRKRVRDTTVYPHSAVVLITFEDQRCTGWMISRDTVATAGHCVHSGGPRGRWFRTASYRIMPGRDGGRRPFGACRARTLYSNTGWTEKGRPAFDYGAIKLTCSIGTRTGTFGFAWTPGSLNGTEVHVAGYPGERRFTQWISSGPIELSHKRELFYKNDTTGGQSGAPVYAERKGCGVCALAVHAYGLFGRPPYNRHNHGVRITREVFEQFQQWIAD